MKVTSSSDRTTVQLAAWVAVTLSYFFFHIDNFRGF